MEDKTMPAREDLAHQLTERFGPLLTQTQLAELLGRTTGGPSLQPMYAERRQDTGAQSLRAEDWPAGLLPRH